MTKSILNYIKEAVGAPLDDHHFDTELIMHINTAFMILHQRGVGPKEYFAIQDDTATWDQFTINPVFSEGVKTFVFLHTKCLFDPPQSGAVLTAYQDQKEMIANRLADAGEIDI